METSRDILNFEKQLKFQKEIEKIIYKDNFSSCSVDFIYHEFPNTGYDLFVITENPMHNTPFLLCKTHGITHADAALAALEYIDSHRAIEYTFTVEWKNNKESDTKISYFIAKDILAALDKFYFNKDKEDYFIFSIKTNPIT